MSEIAPGISRPILTEQERAYGLLLSEKLALEQQRDELIVALFGEVRNPINVRQRDDYDDEMIVRYLRDRHGLTVTPPDPAITAMTWPEYLAWKVARQH